MIKPEKEDIAEVDLVQNKLKSIVERGYGILKKEWLFVGHPNRDIHKKEEFIEGQLKNFFKELYAGEVKWRKEREIELEELRCKAKELAVALKEEQPDFIEEKEEYKGGIYKFEKRLTNFYNLLKKESQDKFSLFKETFDETKQLCKELDEKAPNCQEIERGEVLPSDQTISKLVELNKLMMQKKKEIEDKVKEQRTKAVELFSCLGISPQSEQELFIINDDKSINKKTLEDLNVLIKNLEMQVKAATEERKILCSKIDTLSSLCGRPKEELPSGITIPTLMQLREKITKLANERKSNIEKLLGDAVGNITELKNLLFNSELTKPCPAPTRYNPFPTPIKKDEEINAKNELKELIKKRARQKEENLDEIEILESKNENCGPSDKKKPKCESETAKEIEEEIQILRPPAKRAEILEDIIDPDILNKKDDDNVDDEFDGNKELSTLTSSSTRTKRYTKEDDILMMKMVGASKWHGYIHGTTIWKEIASRKDGMQGRSHRSLHWHFLHNVLNNFESYRISEAEKKRYAKASDLRYKLDKLPPPPFNPNYRKYVL